MHLTLDLLKEDPAESSEKTLLISILRLCELTADLQQSNVSQKWQDVKDGDFFSHFL